MTTNLTAPIHVNSESDDIAAIRLAYAAVEGILQHLNYSRRQALALDHLETSAMFAVKAAYEDAAREHKD
jgi:hypothetical protein